MKNKLDSKKLMQKVKNNRLVILLFILSTAFFVYQHTIYTSWDFSTYVLNGKYLFGNGSYFEILRPPLMPVILGLFSFLGWRAAEFAFIVFASALFAYSSVRLAKNLKFNASAFYFLSLNFYLLNYGLVNGTELLCLALLELFISFLLEENYFSGLLLGLSALSRYASLALFPLIFLHLSAKKIIKSLLLFGAVIFVWFAYNFYKTGNFFTSLADQYANNILYRPYLTENINPLHFFDVQNILILFFILGIVIALAACFSKIKRAKKKDRSVFGILNTLKIELIMFFILIYTVLSYANVPIKDVRYLFNLVIPTVYFSYIGIDFWLMKLTSKKFKNSRKMIAASIIIFVLSAVLLFVKFPVENHNPKEPYVSAIDKINELNLSECRIKSNSWINLNYYGLPCAPSRRADLVEKDIKNGNTIVFFMHESEPEYLSNSTFVSSLPIIYNNSKYIIAGEGKCGSAVPVDDSYVEQIESVVRDINRDQINTNPCFILFMNSQFIEKSCNFVNFNGFRQDKNRKYE